MIDLTIRRHLQDGLSLSKLADLIQVYQHLRQTGQSAHFPLNGAFGSVRSAPFRVAHNLTHKPYACPESAFTAPPKFACRSYVASEPAAARALRLNLIRIPRW